MDKTAEAIRCRVVFTEMLAGSQVPGASVKEFENHTGTLVYCTKPTFKGFYHAVLELDEPVPTFGGLLRSCWLARTEAEIAEMNASPTLWCEVYILPEKPELVDRFAEFCEEQGFSTFLPSGAEDYKTWQQVQPLYAAWLEKQR